MKKALGTQMKTWCRFKNIYRFHKQWINLKNRSKIRQNWVNNFGNSCAKKYHRRKNVTIWLSRSIIKLWVFSQFLDKSRKYFLKIQAQYFYIMLSFQMLELISNRKSEYRPKLLKCLRKIMSKMMEYPSERSNFMLTKTWVL